MPNLFFAKEELKFAREELNLFMREGNGTMRPNKHWANFLTHLELTFIKAERGCQDIKNFFLPFQGYYKNIRKNDPLLSYLKNARDATQHGIDIIVSLEIKEKIQVDTIKLTRLDKDGKEIGTEEHPLYPAEMRLKSFFINGKNWNPPKAFLGKPLRLIDNPYEVGILGIVFYDDFIKKAEEKFRK